MTFRRRASPSRSRYRALRSCRASFACDAIWPRHPGVKLVLAVIDPVDARLSRTALAEAERPINAARETGHAPTLMFALGGTTNTHICSRDYATANTHINECAALAEEKSAVYWKGLATAQRGCVGITGVQSTGATLFTTMLLSYLALANADLGKFDHARRCVGEAMTTVETANERWFEAEVQRIAGEIALMSPQRDGIFTWRDRTSSGRTPMPIIAG
jgi:hypothetical protein